MKLTVRAVGSNMQPTRLRWLVMKRTDTSDWPCTIARSVDVLGDHWNLLIIRQACLGTRRFDDFQAALGTGRNILSQRLSRLVDEGLLERVQYQDSPPRHEYRLTDKGLDLYPMLAALAEWGNRYLADPEGPPVAIVHRDCGEEVQTVMRCAAGHEALKPREVATAPGRGARRR